MRLIRDRSIRASGACVLAAVAIGCAQQSAPLAAAPPSPPVLTWLAEFTRPSGAIYPTLADSARFGEVSGLVLDASSGQWIAVLDDRDTRVAWLSIDYAGGQLNVSPTRLVPLRPGPEVSDRVVTRADLEAIVALPDGTFLMQEEGHLDKGEIWQPVILHVTREGLVTEVIDYPSMFHIQADGSHGLRPNLGFESLVRLPNGHLIAGLEQPLIEDGPLTSFDQDGRARLLEFARENDRWTAGRQWTYPLDRTPRRAGFESMCDGGGNSLVELLALTDTTLLSLERACLQNPATRAVASPVQIFFVELEGDTARKTRVLDVSTVAPRLSPAMQHLDNFEAMSFGPSALNGAPTLLIVSDDNFRKTQKTSFLLFAIDR